MQVRVHSGHDFMLHERSGIFRRLREEAVQYLRAQGYEGSVNTLHWSLERDTLQ